jgi:hypothetical protein
MAREPVPAKRNPFVEKHAAGMLGMGGNDRPLESFRMFRSVALAASMDNDRTRVPAEASRMAVAKSTARYGR